MVRSAIQAQVQEKKFPVPLAFIVHQRQHHIHSTTIDVSQASFVCQGLVSLPKLETIAHRLIIVHQEQEL